MTLGPTRAAGAARPSRQAPTDLTISFADETTVRHQSKTFGEPGWLLDDRLAALGRFRELPIESQVLYTTYVDLRNARLGEVRPARADSVGDQAPGRAVAAAELPIGSAGLIEIGDGGVVRLALDPAAAGQGVVLEDLEQLLGRDPARARDLLARQSLPGDDKLAQLTRALWSRGVHLSVPHGVRLDRPILVRWLGAPAGSALLTRTFVELGSNAEVKIVEELESGSTGVAGGPAQALFTGTTEVHLGSGSNLSVSSLQDLGPEQVAFHHRVGIVGRQANLHWALAQLGSRLARSRIDNRLEGDGGSVEQVEIVFGSSDQLLDLTSYTRHVGRDTTSNLLSKAVLQDAARTFLKGLVTIEKSAIGTDSFLGEYGMNLSKKARAVAIPSLEIDQPDCRRVMHSSSVGPIDETQLFYLESRGIPPDEARKFIVLGFLEPVVARVPLESAEARLRELLEAKWDAGHEDSAAA